MSKKLVAYFSASGTNLASSASSATWLSGNRFDRSASQSTIANWVNGLDLMSASQN